MEEGRSLWLKTDHIQARRLYIETDIAVFPSF